MVDLEDPRTGNIAEVMTNPTCKRILIALESNELSESELASRLSIPAPTVHYNVKKLISSGLIESHSSLWSLKGRSVRRYRLSRTRIVISPRSLRKGVIPALLISVFIAAILKFYSSSASYSSSIALKSLPSDSFAASAETFATNSGSESFYSFLASAPSSWAWFLIGSLSALVIYLLWAWFRE